MQEYYFLFSLAFVWVTFAVVQDLRSREISNWLNFSLIAFALAYRLFYSISFSNYEFFLYGVGGVFLFIILGNLLYYSKVFAGGDAKLLMGIGAVLPFSAMIDYLYFGLGFVFLLFLCGAIYTIFYSFFLVSKTWKAFSKDFSTRIKKNQFLFLLLACSVIGAFLFFFYYNLSASVGLSFFLLVIFVIFPFIFAYVKSIEAVCMIKYVDAWRLTEGDWLEKEITAGNRTIVKSVHGLTKEEIEFLRKKSKKVWIKEGVPFAPAFMIGFLIFVYVWLRYFSF